MSYLLLDEPDDDEEPLLLLLLLSLLLSLLLLLVLSLLLRLFLFVSGRLTCVDARANRFSISSGGRSADKVGVTPAARLAERDSRFTYTVPFGFLHS